LLAELLAVEVEFGRQRLEPEAGEAYASRSLDLDLIYCRGERVDTEFLQLPHPRAAERSFVLAPLAELWPDLCLDHPAEPVSVLLKRLAQE
jgi:2-amino-4-hydroxy-6-hydroxymethyldihydropteridine diphosphokinase